MAKEGKDDKDMRTVSFRLKEELHAQLALIAQVDGKPIYEEIADAVTLLIETKRSEPGYAEQAETMLAEIDRQASARKTAIATLFKPSPEGEATKGRGGRRPSDGEPAG